MKRVAGLGRETACIISSKDWAVSPVWESCDKPVFQVYHVFVIMILTASTLWNPVSTQRKSTPQFLFQTLPTGSPLTTARRPAFFTGTAKRGQFKYDEANLLAADIRYTIYIRVCVIGWGTMYVRGLFDKRRLEHVCTAPAA